MNPLLAIAIVVIVDALAIAAILLVRRRAPEGSFFADSGEMKRSQAMLIGSATTIVAVTLLVIYALDNPYRPGLASIKPVAMERTQVLLTEARGAVSDTSAIPCDEDRNPAP